jgi:hypothetical protein
VLGVSHIWVEENSRRCQLATKLLDAARACLVYGYAVPLAELAFSHPTPAGLQFAQRYTGVSALGAGAGAGNADSSGGGRSASASQVGTATATATAMATATVARSCSEDSAPAPSSRTDGAVAAVGQPGNGPQREKGPEKQLLLY